MTIKLAELRQRLGIPEPTSLINLPNGRLKPGVREEMIALRSAGEKIKTIAEAYKTNTSTVRRIISGERHR